MGNSKSKSNEYPELLYSEFPSPGQLNNNIQSSLTTMRHNEEIHSLPDNNLLTIVEPQITLSSSASPTTIAPTPIHASSLQSQASTPQPPLQSSSSSSPSSQSKSQENQSIIKNDNENLSFICSKIILPKFSVVLMDANDKECLSGDLEIAPDNLYFYAHSSKNPGQRKKLAYWPYQTIRKYGYGEDSLVIEFGRRSPTGPGYYCFKSVESECIYKSIFERISRLEKSTTTTATTTNATTSATNSTTTSSIPNNNIITTCSSSAGRLHHHLHQHHQQQQHSSPCSIVHDNRHIYVNYPQGGASQSVYANLVDGVPSIKNTN